MYAKNSAHGCSAFYENSSPSTQSASNEPGSLKLSVNYAERMKAESWAYQMEVEDNIPSSSLAAEIHKATVWLLTPKLKIWIMAQMVLIPWNKKR